MTLRDYFASKVLPSLVMSSNGKSIGYDSLEYNKTLASVSYLLADAMIAERNKS